MYVCIWISVFTIVPAVPLYQLVLYSFTNYDIFHAPEFGLDNYVMFKGQGILEFNGSY